jgi:acetyl esterase/lipase
MKRSLTWLPWCLLALLGCSTVSSQIVTGFQPRSITINGQLHRYAVYLPPGYDPSRQWPLLVFLNGKGECGTDGERHLRVGLGPALQAEPERWPFVVVMPQKPQAETWWTDHEDLVLATTEATEREFKIDPQRRFLTGLSQGGHGAWAIGARHPSLWAAIAPICGFRIGELPVSRLRNTPLWAFHGMADPIVPAQQTQRLVAELREAGGKPLMTLYDKIGHNSWDLAYRQSGLAEWLSWVAQDRLGAHYLADPSQLTEAEFTIDLIDGTPATRRTVTVRAKAGEIRLQLSHGLADSRQYTVAEAGQSDWRELGHWPAKLLYEPWRHLQRSGCMIASPAPTGPIDQPVRTKVAIQLRGPDGPWHFQQFVTTGAAESGEWEHVARSLAGGFQETASRMKTR